MNTVKLGNKIFSEAQQRFVKPIKCPECKELVIPQIINYAANLTLCPKCGKKISG